MTIMMSMTTTSDMMMEAWMWVVLGVSLLLLLVPRVVLENVSGYSSVISLVLATRKIEMVMLLQLLMLMVVFGFAYLKVIVW